MRRFAERVKQSSALHRTNRTVDHLILQVKTILSSALFSDVLLIADYIKIIFIMAKIFLVIGFSMPVIKLLKRIERPWPDVSEARRRIMRANKASNTGPELELRRMLHGMGYRFRLHRRDLPGRPDLVFPGRKAVIQVHGCFWHQHPGCRHAHLPRSRTEYWSPKLARNVERDGENERRLEAMGWRVLVVWECALTDCDAVAARVRDFLGPPRPALTC